jgi:hypothetical protein
MWRKAEAKVAKNSLYKIEFSQQFRGSSGWVDDTATVVARRRNADEAIDKLRRLKLKDSLSDATGGPCTSVRIHSCVPVSNIDIL